MNLLFGICFPQLTQHFFVFAECTALEQEGTSLLQWFFQRTLGATGNVFFILQTKEDFKRETPLKS